MEMEQECHNCIYRATAWKCTNLQSPLVGTRVQPDDSCDHFKQSEGQAYSSEASLAELQYLEPTTVSESDKRACLDAMIANNTRAIAAQLPTEDQVNCQLGLAKAYAYRVMDSARLTKKWDGFNSSDSALAIEHFQKAARLDRETGVGWIAQIPEILASVDRFLELKASWMLEAEPEGAYEFFVQQQLSAVQHVPHARLPRLLLSFGKYYGRAGRYQEAAKCFKSILETLNHGYLGDASMRDEAQRMYDKSVELSGTNERAAVSGPPVKRGSRWPVIGFVALALAAFGYYSLSRLNHATNITAQSQVPTTPSFSCAQAKSGTDRLICRDNDLAALERNMVDTYNRLLAQTAANQKATLRADHKKWYVNYERACNALTAQGNETGAKGCITKQLTDHTQELEAQLRRNSR